MNRFRKETCIMIIRNFGKKILAAAAIAIAIGATQVLAEEVKVDPAISKYNQRPGVSGNLSSIGSDTLNNLMTYWAESFNKVYPNVRIQVEGKGSSTAPPALIAGTAQLGPMSRMMKKQEIEEFEKKFGYKPTPIGVALDALAVFVHKDNPLATLTLPQVDAIFSKTSKSGHNPINTWGDAGLTGKWAPQPISIYGRNSASGTYGYFKEHALAKGDFKDTVKEQPGSAAVVMSVTEDKNAIGYSGIGYVTSGVKMLPLAAKNGGKAMEGTYANVLSGDYPLSRMLYIYVAKDPKKPLSPVVAEFLKYVLSREGQAIVIKDGYLPLPAAAVATELAKLK